MEILGVGLSLKLNLLFLRNPRFGSRSSGGSFDLVLAWTLPIVARKRMERRAEGKIFMVEASWEKASVFQAVDWIVRKKWVFA